MRTGRERLLQGSKRRGRPAGYWRSGIDAATGRRVPVTIKTPAELAGAVRGGAA